MLQKLLHVTKNVTKNVTSNKIERTIPQSKKRQVSLYRQCSYCSKLPSYSEFSCTIDIVHQDPLPEMDSATSSDQHG